MSDEFTPYEHGIRHLLTQLPCESSAYQEALLLQQRLERNITEARKYGPESTQKSDLNRILDALNGLSLQNTEKSFNEWCKTYSPEADEMQRPEQYVDNLEPLRTGSIHQDLTNQLTKIGAKPKAGKNAIQEDILERYAQVPLHALFLYTSQDENIAPYILEHWGSLDTLSGDVCDIHPAVDQFKNIEDAYVYIKQLNVIKEAKFQAYSNLPGLFFWDHEGNTEFISFGPKANFSEITYIIRVIFEEVHKEPGIAAVTHAKRLLEQ